MQYYDSYYYGSYDIEVKTVEVKLLEYWRETSNYCKEISNYCEYRKEKAKCCGNIFQSNY